MSGGDEPPRFLVDAMLAKLGAYLRVLGYDAASADEVPTPERVRRADAEGRVLLTRSGRLGLQAPVPRRALRVASEDPVEQLREVLVAFGLDPAARRFSRCIRCNVALEELAELGERAERVPPQVRARHRRFWRCPSCDTVFWRGSHVARTLAKLGLAPADDEGA